MRSYCTLFDRNYLFQGVALYDSLIKVSDSFVLYTLCMDNVSYGLLRRLELPGVVPILYEELLTDEVRAVKEQTTRGQFCWACQPLLCKHLLQKHDLDLITYLEADSFFFNDPELIFDELGEDAVSVVPHRFPPDRDYSKTAGRYCVQFNAFRNNGEGKRVLDFWIENCFKYSKDKPDEHPGQMCLDAWTEFESVKEIAQIGAGAGPWNIIQYQIEVKRDRVFVDGKPLIFYHYHQFSWIEGGGYYFGHYPLGKGAIALIYRPYVEALVEAERKVHSVDRSFDFRKRTFPNPVTLFGKVKRSIHNLKYGLLRG